jgi:hypothetical protein
MASSKVLDGYPQSWGDKRVSVFYHTGPVLYVPVVVATPVTTGDPVTDVEAGLRYIEYLYGGVSDNGQYRVEAIPGGGNPSQAQGAGQGGTVGAPQRTWRLRWFVVSTGVEAAAVDLSARTVRLMAIGSK